MVVAALAVAELAAMEAATAAVTVVAMALALADVVVLKPHVDAVNKLALVD